MNLRISWEKFITRTNQLVYSVYETSICGRKVIMIFCNQCFIENFRLFFPLNKNSLYLVKHFHEAYMKSFFIKLAKSIYELPALQKS